MTEWQREALRRVLARPHITGIVHGDCLGVDAEADGIAMTLGLARFAYPSNAWFYRAHRNSQGCVFLAEPAPPKVRDRWIVEKGGALVGIPRPSSQGTWFTIGIGRELRRPLLVLGEDRVLESTRGAEEQ